MNDKIIRRHTASSLSIKWLPRVVPRKAKPGTRTRSYMMDQPLGTSQLTVSYHSEVCAFEEAGSLSTPRAALSGPKHVALRTHS